MGLLNQKGKATDKKKGNNQKPAAQGSKFMTGKATKANAPSKKIMTGGSQRGS